MYDETLASVDAQMERDENCRPYDYEADEELVELLHESVEEHEEACRKLEADWLVERMRGAA